MTKNEIEKLESLIQQWKNEVKEIKIQIRNSPETRLAEYVNSLYSTKDTLEKCISDLVDTHPELIGGSYE